MEFLKVNIEFSRGGSVCSLELITEAEKEFFNYAMNNELQLDLGECLGKHSEVIITLEKNEPCFCFTELSDLEIDLVKNKLEIQSFGDVIFSDAVKKAVYRYFAGENEIGDECVFSEWCENEKEILRLSELNDSLISEYAVYYRQYETDEE